MISKESVLIILGVFALIYILAPEEGVEGFSGYSWLWGYPSYSYGYYPSYWYNYPNYYRRRRRHPYKRWYRKYYW